MVLQDAQTRTATDFIHGPAADLITADEVKSAYAGDGRVRSIGDARGVLGQAGGGVPGEAGAVAGHDLAAAEANARLGQPFSDSGRFVEMVLDNLRASGGDNRVRASGSDLSRSTPLRRCSSRRRGSTGKVIWLTGRQGELGNGTNDVSATPVDILLSGAPS